MNVGRNKTVQDGTMSRIVISDLIRQYRREHGLTQGEFGELLHVSAQAVSKWEQGKCCPDIASLPRLADILSCSVNDFFA